MTWRCRLFGHKWRPSHRLEVTPRGRKIWVYTDHVCKWCWSTEWRMPVFGEAPSEFQGQTAGDNL